MTGRPRGPGDNMTQIPFNKLHLTGRELEYIAQAHANQHLSGDGPFTRRCNKWLEVNTAARRALLTHSCTAALEMAAVLADIRPGDEVILPSYTFVSTANAFVLRGGTPVFVDIRPDTLNIDEKKIEAAITKKTKAVVPVHYAGVGCDMDAISEIAARRGLTVIEDAAQGILSTWNGRPLGGIGSLGCLSFHETKNVISGEGGALLVNDERLARRAEIIREKGTNRSAFFRGEIDKYSWVDIGSSWLPGELTAAFLFAQLENAVEITKRRLALWNRYHKALEPLEAAGKIRRPIIPPGAVHNAHMYYILLPNLDARSAFIADMKADGVGAIFHYVPLHTSPAGKKFGRAHGALKKTVELSNRIVRLPLWMGMERRLTEVVEKIFKHTKKIRPAG